VSKGRDERTEMKETSESADGGMVLVFKSIGSGRGTATNKGGGGRRGE